MDVVKNVEVVCTLRVLLVVVTVGLGWACAGGLYGKWPNVVE